MSPFSSKKSKGASLETWNYAYDELNHLTSVEKHATDGGTLQLKVAYKYDALGNRIERTEDSDGNGTIDVTQRFGYDGANVWADLDGNNALTYRRLFGVGIDTPVVRISSAGNVVWYLTDYQNSVTVMVDASGAVLGRISYDGFGNIVTDTTGQNADRFKYTAREWDSSVKLQYNRARYYDPALGKWTSTDPMGFEAGDANLYRYAANGPTNAIDPSGLFIPFDFNPMYYYSDVNPEQVKQWRDTIATIKNEQIPFFEGELKKKEGEYDKALRDYKFQLQNNYGGLATSSSRVQNAVDNLIDKQDHILDYLARLIVLQLDIYLNVDGDDVAVLAALDAYESRVVSYNNDLFERAKQLYNIRGLRPYAFQCLAEIFAREDQAFEIAMDTFWWLYVFQPPNFGTAQPGG